MTTHAPHLKTRTSIHFYAHFSHISLYSFFSFLSFFSLFSFFSSSSTFMIIRHISVSLSRPSDSRRPGSDQRCEHQSGGSQPSHATSTRYSKCTNRETQNATGIFEILSFTSYFLLHSIHSNNFLFSVSGATVAILNFVNCAGRGVGKPSPTLLNEALRSERILWTLDCLLYGGIDTATPSEQ